MVIRCPRQFAFAYPEEKMLVLAEYGYPPITNDEVFKEIFEHAENFKKYND